MDNFTLKLDCSFDRVRSFINAEVSLPKLLHGNNVEMLKSSDLPYICDTITELVSEQTKIEFDASKARVTRLDICHNFQFDSDIEASLYRDVIGTKQLPRFIRSITSKRDMPDTVYFETKQHEIAAYLKHAESKHLLELNKISPFVVELSKGILRLEHRYLKTKKTNEIAELYGIENTGGNYMTHANEIYQNTMTNDIKALGMDKPTKLENFDTRMKKLADRANPKHLQRLAGFLTLCDSLGERNLVSLGIVSKSRFYETKNEIIALGVSIERIFEPITIEALTI